MFKRFMIALTLVAMLALPISASARGRAAVDIIGTCCWTLIVSYAGADVMGEPGRLEVDIAGSTTTFVTTPSLGNPVSVSVDASPFPYGARLYDGKGRLLAEDQ